MAETKAERRVKRLTQHPTGIDMIKTYVPQSEIDQVADRWSKLVRDLKQGVTIKGHTFTYEEDWSPVNADGSPAEEGEIVVKSDVPHEIWDKICDECNDEIFNAYYESFEKYIQELFPEAAIENRSANFDAGSLSIEVYFDFTYETKYVDRKTGQTIYVYRPRDNNGVCSCSHS